MSFELKLRAFFTSEIRQQGYSLFSASKVHLIAKSAHEVSALVEGAEPCYCTLRAPHSQLLKQRVVTVSCSCPYFKKWACCAHLWSLALELDKHVWGEAMGEEAEVYMEEESYPAEGDAGIAERIASAQKELATLKAEKSIPWEEFRRKISHDRTPPSVFFTETVVEQAACDRSLFYILDLGDPEHEGKIALRLFSREIKDQGAFGPFKPLTTSRRLDRSFRDANDQRLFDLLGRSCDGFIESPSRRGRSMLRVVAERESLQGLILPAERTLALLKLIHAEQRLYAWLRGKKAEPAPLLLDEESWFLAAQLRPHDEQNFRIEVFLSRGDDRRDPRRLGLLAGGRAFIDKDSLCAAQVSSQQLTDWVHALADKDALIVPRTGLDLFMREYAQIPSAPPMSWPAESGWIEEWDTPQPMLRLSPSHLPLEWTGELLFRYRRALVNTMDAASRWIDPAERVILLRDPDIEAQLLAELLSVPGITRTFANELLAAGRIVRVALPHLPTIVASLEEKGWRVEAENQRVRVLRDIEVQVSGGIDWLDIAIKARLDAELYELPSLLRQRKSGEQFIRLGHGELALLPEDWTQRLGILAASGDCQGESFRVPSRQALFLDSLFADVPLIDRSERLEDVRNRLQRVIALEPTDPASSFCGTLRPYQREGLAWLECVKDLGLGVCLADDMGLGKTVQVLALLQRYHHGLKQKRCSLIVLPRSLVGNWMAEAARFCPDLKIKDMSSGSRDWRSVFDEDLLLITYGTLRQDIEELSQKAFAYVILDEAQAIKNEGSQTARAACLLRAQHRLALTGTPIENHLGELRSLLHFLNPGLLDHGFWADLLQKNSELSAQHTRFLSRALRPLILRRTKAKVLNDLPPKIEHVLLCELEGEQRRQYDELRDHYKRHLLPELQEGPWRKSPMIVMEALLRLRQAACHPGLISGAHQTASSAKMEVLFEKLVELRAAGRKALIFSQFTSFLKIIARRLEAEGVPHLYLDGQTRDRTARVELFQSDPAIPCFLMSLKAGGVGFNLTAADYCFLLDPWWNPAVEAQAIDRAHRINQKNTVFAYRLIAKDTVEEKIQELQKDKKLMADSLLDADGSFLQTLDLKAIHSLFA